MRYRWIRHPKTTQERRVAAALNRDANRPRGFGGATRPSAA